MDALLLLLVEPDLFEPGIELGQLILLRKHLHGATSGLSEVDLRGIEDGFVPDFSDNAYVLDVLGNLLHVQRLHLLPEQGNVFLVDFLFEFIFVEEHNHAVLHNLQRLLPWNTQKQLFVSKNSLSGDVLEAVKVLGAGANAFPLLVLSWVPIILVNFNFSLDTELAFYQNKERLGYISLFIDYCASLVVFLSEEVVEVGDFDHAPLREELDFLENAHVLKLLHLARIINDLIIPVLS